MKIFIGQSGPVKFANEMGIGEIGVLDGPRRGDCKGHVVLRTYDGLVSLTNPLSTWHGATFPVRVLPPGTVITLVTE